MSMNKMFYNLGSEFVAWGGRDNKSATQPVHLHRMLKAFVICYLKSTEAKVASYKISIF